MLENAGKTLALNFVLDDLSSSNLTFSREFTSGQGCNFNAHSHSHKYYSIAQGRPGL